jgi:hypothetical protein
MVKVVLVTATAPPAPIAKMEKKGPVGRLRGWFGSLHWYSWILLIVWVVSMAGALDMSEGMFYEGNWMIGDYLLLVPTTLLIVGLLWIFLIPRYTTPYIERKWGKGRPLLVYLVVLVIFLAWLTIYLTT